MAKKIVGFLDVKSLLRVSETSQSWRDLALLENHWESAYLCRWKTFSIQSISSRTWLQTFKDRHVVEKELKRIKDLKSKKNPPRSPPEIVVNEGIDEELRENNPFFSIEMNEGENESLNEISTLENVIEEEEEEEVVPVSKEEESKMSMENFFSYGDDLKKRAENRIASAKSIEMASKDVEEFEDSELKKFSTECLLQIATEEYASAIHFVSGIFPSEGHSNSNILNSPSLRFASSIFHIASIITSLTIDDRTTVPNSLLRTGVSSELFLKYADVLAMIARLQDTKKENMKLIGKLFIQASQFYDKAAQPGFFMRENALRYSGDCLVDLSRKTKPEKAPELLFKACEKYEQSIEVNPTYFMAHYYHGRALHFLANSKKGQPDADIFFIKAIDKFEFAKTIKMDDVYLYYEHASVLQDFALTKVGEEAEGLYQQATDMVIFIRILFDSVFSFKDLIKKYGEAHRLAPEDPWILRNWADSHYDHAKLLFSQIEEEERNHLDRIETFGETFVKIENKEIVNEWNPYSYGDRGENFTRLIELACEKYELAVKLNPNYSTAFNSWALALSTRAKVGWEENRSKNYFEGAYDKFEKAIKTRTESTNTEVCNWSMTLISQAIKEAKSHLREQEFVPTRLAIVSTLRSHPKCKEHFKEAREKLLGLAEKKDSWSYFCMARYYAAKGDEEKCQIWLEKCSTDRYLRRATRWQLAYFDNVKDTDWFKNILKECQNSLNSPVL